MSGPDITQSLLFSYRTLEERISQKHPLRKLQVVVNGLLSVIDEELDALYPKVGRDSIPPEHLRTSLIQTLHSIRSERALVEHIEYNLLYPCTTDPGTSILRLYKKAEGDKSRLAYLGHALMESRHGAVVDGEVTHATSRVEREAAKAMAARTVTRQGATLGADKDYYVAEFVEALRKQGCGDAHRLNIAQEAKAPAIDRRTTRYPGYGVSLRFANRRCVLGKSPARARAWSHCATHGSWDWQR